MIILGVDPGLQRTGYGVIEKENKQHRYITCGIIQTSPKSSLSQRLLKIYSELEDVNMKYQPTVCVLEQLYAHYKHPTTLGILGHVRGIICLFAAKNNLSVFEYPYTRIRKALVGKGQAKKYQVRGMVRNFMSECSDAVDSLPDDASDALAVALTHSLLKNF